MGEKSRGNFTHNFCSQRVNCKATNCDNCRFIKKVNGNVERTGFIKKGEK